MNNWCPDRLVPGQRTLVRYHDADVWHERCLLGQGEIDDAVVWMILMPGMTCHAEDLSFNLGVGLAGPCNADPRRIPRGQAYCFDAAIPTEGEFEAYQELADVLIGDETGRMRREGYTRRCTGLVPGRRADDKGPPDDGGKDGGDDDDGGEEVDESAGGNDGIWRVFSLGGALDHGDECTPPEGAASAGGAKRCVLEGRPIAAKREREAGYEVLIAAVAAPVARILPVSRGRGGRRHKSCVVENSGSGGSGRLASKEQAMFAGSSGMATSLVICPSLLDPVKQGVDREGGLLKNLAKCREARAALRKK